MALSIAVFFHGWWISKSVENACDELACLVDAIDNAHVTFAQKIDAKIPSHVGNRELKLDKDG